MSMEASNKDYSRLIANAFAAVRQLYADTSKLLIDCDSSLGKGKKSVFGNEITRDLSRALGGHSQWMPSALYRFYVDPDAPNVADGITICLQDDSGVDPPYYVEPLLLVGDIQLNEPADFSNLRSAVLPWALWNAFFSHDEAKELEKVILTKDAEGCPVARVVAVPLYSIRSICDVARWTDLVKATPHETPTPVSNMPQSIPIIL